jgi:RNA polymerase sigma-70 factor (ECF subfamily)
MKNHPKRILYFSILLLFTLFVIGELASQDAVAQTPKIITDTSPSADAQTLLNKAEGLYGEKKFDEAIKTYEEVYTKYPNWNQSANALMMVGICYDNLGQKEKAIEYLEKASKEYPNLKNFSDTIFFYLGLAYYRLGQKEKAAEALKKSVELGEGIRTPESFPYKNAKEWLVKIQSEKAPSATSVAPQIVKTIPMIGAKDVDPSIKEIIVVFDRDMGAGFSWTGGGEQFPKTTGNAVWRDSRTCVLPVALEPGKSYRFGINAPSYKNFRSKEGVPVEPVLFEFVTSGTAISESAPIVAPKIVSILPQNGAQNVSPSITELRVAFDQEMGGGFSWTGGGPNYPEITSRPYWAEDKKTCVLPVKLKPNWTYRLGLNSVSFKNFQNTQGIPLEPVVYTFTTGSQ